jgi:hypothetical protein
LLQNEATFEPDLVNIAEYLNTQYKEETFVNTVESHESYQPTRVKQVREQEMLQ